MNPADNLTDESRCLSQGTVRVVLEGGPADLPAEIRLDHHVVADRKVKLPRRGGYEHFELVAGDGSEPCGLVVFRWTMRTKVAE